MYEHVRAKARGLFNYKSNSLDLERDEIAKMRVQRRGECGWASSIHKPYRPLGTPDMLEKVKFEFLKESLKNQAAAPGKAKPASTPRNMELSLENLELASSSTDASMKESKVHGASKLRTEIRNSNTRRIGCRSGASFQVVLSRQQPLVSPKKGKKKSLDSNSTPSKSVESHSIFAQNSASAAPGAIRGFPSILSPSKKGALGKDDKAEKKHGLSIQLPNLPSEGLGGSTISEELLTLDPSTSMSNRLNEFRKAKNQMNSKLASRLDTLTEQRLDTYQRKLQAFRTDYRNFSIERWKLEAEKVKIKAKLASLTMHKWYFNFIQFWEGISRHTPPEKIVLSQVKHVIEEGYEYDHKDFQRLISTLPKRAYKMTSILQILNFLRNEIGIKDDEYNSYLRSCEITIPTWSINSTGVHSKGLKNRASISM